MTNTGSRVETDEFFSEFLRVKFAVDDGQTSGEFFDQRVHRFEIVPVARHQVQPDCPAQAINDDCKFGVRPFFGAANRMCSGSPDGVRPGLTYLDVSAVHAAKLVAGVVGKLGEYPRPKFHAAPPTKARVDRRPRTELSWQISPRHSSSQDVVNPAYHDAIVFRWPSATPHFGDTSSASLIRSIFYPLP